MKSCTFYFWTIHSVVVSFVLWRMVNASIANIITATTSTTTSVSSIIKSRILERQRRSNNDRKLIQTDESSSSSSSSDEQYIVVFDPDRVTNVTKKLFQLFHNHNSTTVQIGYLFDTIAMKGVVIRNVTNDISRTELFTMLESDPQVLLIQPEISMSYDTTNHSPQYNATYHLDRLDNKVLPLDGVYNRKSDGGKNVTVYVLDSGIRTSHTEFDNGQRASCGFDAILHYESDVPCDDLLGHGTHIAGLIGGKTIGVASQVNLVSVKVASKDFIFEGSAVLYGLQYVLLEKLRNPTQPMVVNMSFGGSHFVLLDFMVEALLAVGVTVVASAGNDGSNACHLSPSGGMGVLTVGASTEVDDVPWWSNYGSCVDLYAPGRNIRSAGIASDTDYVLGTGTSQSTPLVVGTVALYLQIQPTLTPSQIFRLITYDSIKNVLKPGAPKRHVVNHNSNSSNTNTTNTTNITTTTNMTTVQHKIYKNRLLYTGIFTDPSSLRTNPTCPYIGRKKYLCYQEGWWTK